MKPTPITFESLRAVGFRLQIPFGNYEPHMRISIDRQHESYLEIGQCGVTDSNDWTVWIVSEMSHSYGRFCFLRRVWTMAQVDAIYESLTDTKMEETFVDPEKFAEALAHCREILKSHWDQIYTKEEMRKHILTR